MSIDYFMDKLKYYEINSYIENLPYADRPNLEMLRFNAYVVAQVNSKKKLKPEELIKFQWEKDADELQDEMARMAVKEEAKPLLTKAEVEEFAKRSFEVLSNLQYKENGNKNI